MQSLQKNDWVQIVDLLRSQRPFSATADDRRPPALGDVGCIEFVFDGDCNPASFIVACYGGDGHRIWMAEFRYDELQPVTPPSKVA